MAFIYCFYILFAIPRVFPFSIIMRGISEILVYSFSAPVLLLSCTFLLLSCTQHQRLYNCLSPVLPLCPAFAKIFEILAFFIFHSPAPRAPVIPNGAPRRDPFSISSLSQSCRRPYPLIPTVSFRQGKNFQHNFCDFPPKRHAYSDSVFTFHRQHICSAKIKPRHDYLL